MSDKRFVRGASVNISVQFKDIAGAVITTGISSANLRLSYRINKVSQTEEITLTDAGSGNWTAEWASDAVDQGPVYWWAQSEPPPKSALQGSFTIVANAAALQT